MPNYFSSLSNFNILPRLESHTVDDRTSFKNRVLLVDTTRRTHAERRTCSLRALVAERKPPLSAKPIAHIRRPHIYTARAAFMQSLTHTGYTVPRSPQQLHRYTLFTCTTF